MDLPDQQALREPSQRVSPRAVRMWTVEALFVVAWLVAGMVAWWFLDTGSRDAQWVVGSILLVVSVGYVAIMPRWRFRVHRWEATSYAIYTQTGWIKQERRIAPLSRVQTVDLERGPVAQLFKLASVTVTTASAAGPVKVHGLELAVAEELVEGLTAAAVAEKGDAT
ncbi:hypothetical protein BA895_06890 [Humibacillus sp. DSM 29435]|uniref:PH domain-containing protein n=1 Tax=Humibacillus sp. DSM 29435 TaxID=1869167 RepID=UPI000871DAE0|nr:PH domain-containing protein [Humibacillus sp. DSM 29435]OFE15426.1 hypothetical protein BA895_06890 [Humibacillus sp. DSM 29435]